MTKLNFCSIILLVSMGLSTATYANTKSTSWKINKSEWTSTDEKNYEEFIEKLGEGRAAGACFTTDECLRSSVANPFYYRKTPSGMTRIFSDCADLPYILRAYFAWMNDLPFTYQSGHKIVTNLDKMQEDPLFIELDQRIKNAKAIIASEESILEDISFFKFKDRKVVKNRIDAQEDEIKRLEDLIEENFSEGEDKRREDIRYSKNGNAITRKTTIKNGDNINTVLKNIANSVSTASFRVNAAKYDSGSLFRDTYPVTLDREGITPGTILYDPAGHIGVVYKVTKDGRIYLIDAHPDNSLTKISFGEKFSRSPAIRGAGFQKFRPFKVTSNGYRARKNSELDNFSLQTYLGYPEVPGVKLSKTKYIKNGENLSYHDYIRSNLSVGDLKIDPLKELTVFLDDLCSDMTDRIDSINSALKVGIQNTRHPSRLPQNIYGTDGEWETYSTPSRDARLKASIQEAREKTELYIKKYQENDPKIVTDSTDLIGDLKDVYRKKTNSCKLEVTLSRGKKDTIDLDFAIENILNFSFDPYHCAELRWGMLDDNSLSRCDDNKEKFDWYHAEKYLRYQIERDYEKRMDLTLGQLEDTKLGTTVKPNLSIKDAIEFN